MRKLAAALAALCFGLTATQTFAAPNAMTASGVTLANYSTSALTTVTVSMTMNFWYDVDDGTDTGYIDVTFPAGFDLSGIAASSYNSVTADSNWTYTISAPTSSTARLRFHTFNWVQPGQVRTFKIPNVRNPSTAGATGAFSVLGSGYDDNTSLPATVSQTASAVTIITSTTTTLASSSPANTSTYGGSVTLTATVSPSPSGGTVSFKDGATSLCSTVALTGGVATCTTSALTAGTHATIRATYSGNGASATSTSSFLSQTINKRPLSVIANPATRLYGAANPTLTATLIGFVNGQNLATSGATGSASVTTAANPSTPVGAAVLTAAQGSLAAVNYSFTYQTGTLTIGKAPLSVSASPASRVFGAVEPAFLPTYSGFVNGEVLSTSGVAGIPVLTTITTSSSPVASYAINVGLGTLVAANYQVSVVNGVLTVSQASTAIALSSGSAGDASTYGDSVTLTAQVTAVAPGSGLPTGSVTFSDGVATLGSGALDGSARATYTTGATQLGGGARSLTAAYGGASEFLTSTSPTLTQIVALASQTITFSALADKLSTDAPFTLSASAAPGLVVSFSSSTTSVCTVSGVTVTLIGGGTCTVTAAQTGSNNYLAATSVSHSFAVSAPQTITFAAPTSRTYGDASFSLAATASSGLDVTFASTSSSVCVTTGAHGATLSIVAAGTCSLVAAQSGSSAYLAATDVPQQFTLARAPLTIVAIDASRVYGQANPAFSASFSGLVNSDTSSNLGGTLTFGAAASSSSPPARYSVTPAGLTSGNYSISFGAGVLTVTRASSGVVLTPSSVTPVAGQVVTLKAQVSAIVPGAGLSTGVVTFKDGVTVLGAAALDGTGQASQSTVALVDGASHSFIASYAGDGNFTPADSSTVTLAVGQAATLTTLSSPSGGATTYGTPVTVYADIAVVAPGAAAFSGTVTFMDGAAILGTASVDGSGRAALAASGTQLVAGAHSIGALFSGSATLGASSAAVFPLVVGPGPSSVALTTGVPNAVASVGQPVGLTAVVSGASTPSGSVAFNDGATTLGAGQLDGHGSATFTSGPLQLGIGGHDLTATYSGNADLHGSDSSAVSVQVVQATTVTSLVGGPNPATTEQTEMLSAWVVADLSTAGVPGGSMTFRNADTVLVTVAVDATGQASYSVMLGAGLASLTATYNGDTSFAASASAMLPMTVTQPTHGDSGGGHSAAPPRPVAAPVAPGFAGGGLAPVVTVASAPVGSPPVAAAAASGVTAEAPIRVTTVLPPPLIARQADPQQADPRQADPATLGWSTAVTDGLRIEVQTDTAALVTGSTIDARQVSLGGGNAEPLSAPIEVRLIARDLASGTEVALPDATQAQTLSISLPVLAETLAAGDTFTWLVEVREDGQFLGYMRYPSTLDALTGMLVYDIPATTLQQSSVLPVILHPASVQTFVADVHVYSSPLRSAEDFGVVGEVWSTFDVIAPQVGGRIGVRLPATDELVWIDADGVGPSGEGITV